MTKHARQLPVRPETGGRQTEGYATPVVDRTPQKMSVPPRRVVPIVFLPGIMGTNLRLTPQRQAELKRKNNVAWRPDQLVSDTTKAHEAAHFSPAMRQQLLDPDATEVDTYEPDTNPTGHPTESADQRHDNVKLFIESPLLVDDPLAASPWRSKLQKARARGWGEVMFSSYGELLQRCEERLNTAFFRGQMDPRWRDVVGVEPQRWQHVLNELLPRPKLQALTEEELRRAVRDCWFPVHAVGYNWLQSNMASGGYVADRIGKLMAEYVKAGFQCEKVVVVTHSMGGLVARALIHPKMGNFNDKVLGMVHGVMPATGAGAAYRRMRCGFEGNAIMASVPGNFADEVTSVLANSPGALQLLPSRAYGSGWLEIRHKGVPIKCLPKPGGDPYEEIYKRKDRWYGLLKEGWINPAGPHGKGSLQRSFDYLDDAKLFHDTIEKTYHDNSYAHYGADHKRLAWHRVVWAIDGTAYVGDVEKLKIVDDDRQGHLTTVAGSGLVAGSSLERQPRIHVSSLMASDPGDQTVPQHSADHQLRSGRFKGVFQQFGYEHQGSYQNSDAVACTLFSLVRILEKMVWSK